MSVLTNILQIVIFQLSVSFIWCNTPKALIIEGSAAEHRGSYMAMQRNLIEWDFDVCHYVSDETYGSGMGIMLKDMNLSHYDLILISLQQGTFSEATLSKFADYVLNGGNLYIVYQSYPRKYFVDAIQTNSNSFLELLEINDRVIFSIDDLETSLLGSVKLVDNSTRLDNTSRQSRNKLKRTINRELSQYKAMMRPGHYFERASILDEAHSIIEFNSSNSKKVTSVFWNAGKGRVGIGSELHSSAAANSNVYNSWKLILSQLMRPTPSL